MRIVRQTAVPLLLVIGLPGVAAAQDRPWTVEVAVGHAAFVDDATKHFGVAGGRVRRYVTPRVSIGPELIIMTGGSGGVRDRNITLLGDVVFDLRDGDGPAAPRVIPFVAGGVGIHWIRDIVRDGHYWGRQLGASAGAGVRVSISRRARASLEYRIGSELYQQITGSVGLRW